MSDDYAINSHFPYGSQFAELERRMHSRAPTAHHFEVYPEQILTTKRGFPSWSSLPFASHPKEYREEGVRIGDVGYFREDGNFYYFLNFCSSLDHPVNHPSRLAAAADLKFEPVNLRGREKRTDIPPNTCIKAKSVAQIGDTCFQAVDSDGAMAMYPQGGEQVDLLDPFTLDKTVSQHAEAVYKYIKDVLEFTLIKNGDLKVVTGLDKTQYTAELVFHHCLGAKFELVQMAADVENPELPDYNWSMDFEDNRGRDMEQPEKYTHTYNFSPGSELGLPLDRQPKNPFLRTLTIFLNDELWKSLFPGDSDFVPVYQTEFQRVISSLGDAPFSPYPSSAFKDVLFAQFPNAKVAVVHDQFWMALLRDTDQWMPGPLELLSRARTAYDIVEDNGTVYLSSKGSSNTRTLTLLKCWVPGCDLEYALDTDLRVHFHSHTSEEKAHAEESRASTESESSSWSKCLIA